MKKCNNILAFIIIGGLGSLFHFIYGWTNESFIMGLFFPVNESTFEHLKLIFYPTIIYSVYEYFRLENKPENYIPSVAAGIIMGNLTIVTLFYLYSGILGFNVDFLNITIFFIAVIVSLITKNCVLKSEKFTSKIAVIISVLYLFISALLFAVWSYNPPSLGIFTPPVI